VLAEPATRERLWPTEPPDRPGIEWRGEQQLELVAELGRQPAMLIPEAPTGDPLEHYAPNPSYGYYDSWAMGAMLRHLRPARMIEAGSGWSTLLAARVNREYLRGTMELTCFDPFPLDFIREGGAAVARLVERPIERTPLAEFEALAAGDVLFIDSTHSVKTGGDVVFLFGEVIPRLRPGVVVHVHDIFLPLDYPQPWALEGWSWNEQYLVQAFLAFNSEFQILLATNWLAVNYPGAVVRAAPAPATPRRRFGASLWFRRLPRGG
jgi:Methyltransferase domain